MEKYVVFLDIDGTLVDASHIPTDRVANTVKQAQAAGHKVFINTGRRKRMIPPAVLEKIKPDGLVCSLGQYVEIEGQVIRDEKLSPEAAKIAIELVKRKKYSGNITLNHMEIPSENGVFDEELALKYAVEGEIVKLGLNEDLDREAAEILGKHNTVYQYEKWCETAVKGCDKATGIACVMDYYGMDISRSIAIGDSINDVEMLQGAGIGVAMGNADPRLKELAVYITESFENDGVAVILEQLLEM